MSPYSYKLNATLANINSTAAARTNLHDVKVIVETLMTTHGSRMDTGTLLSVSVCGCTSICIRTTIYLASSYYYYTYYNLASSYYYYIYTIPYT